MKKTTLTTVILAAAFLMSAAAAELELTYTKLWTYRHTTQGQVGEIPAYDSKTNTIWVAGIVGVDVLDAETGTLVNRAHRRDPSRIRQQRGDLQRPRSPRHRSNGAVIVATPAAFCFSTRGRVPPIAGVNKSRWRTARHAHFHARRQEPARRQRGHAEPGADLPTSRPDPPGRSASSMWQPQRRGHRRLRGRPDVRQQPAHAD